MIYIEYMQQCQNKKIPNAVKQLKLCKSLQNCGQSVASCLKRSTAKVLYTYDDTDLTYSDWSESITPDQISRSFIVRNDNEVEIILLPLDNRIISGPMVTKGGVNDCAILTNRQMSLIEFKTNVTSNSYRNMEAKTNYAIKQLWHTFDEIIYPRCKARGIDLKAKIDIDFFVIFDHNLDVINFTASRSEKQVAFLEKTGFQLYFDNEKSFN
ncbi:MAG: hypothetical protein PUB31_03960 [Bacteroidales bacterium]|nr:hypothetical protein [Bacteroidales bacterium]